jgi:ribonuclease-3
MSLTNLESLQQSLGVSFNDPSYLKQALTHTSYVNENPESNLADNERLEFLGDAVLGQVIAEKLYQALPEAAEGEMSKLRAALVSRNALARLSRGIRLGDYLYLGKGEETSGGRDKTANLAGALEAVIAAVFLDQNPATAKDVILALFNPEIERVIGRGEVANYKSQLQELLQARGQPPPDYHVVSASGPDHDRRFTVEVRAGGSTLGQGTGKSKKQAETEAARSALGHFPV